MSPSSITRIPTGKPTLHAFEIDGRVNRPDIEWMADELKTAFAAQGTVDILVLIARWDGIAMDAVFDAKAMSAQGQANRHVRKYAVVGAPDWASAMIKVFLPLTPVEEKTFDLSDVDHAWEWVET